MIVTYRHMCKQKYVARRSMMGSLGRLLVLVVVLVGGFVSLALYTAVIQTFTAVAAPTVLADGPMTPCSGGPFSC